VTTRSVTCVLCVKSYSLVRRVCVGHVLCIFSQHKTHVENVLFQESHSPLTITNEKLYLFVQFSKVLMEFI
jgi:hypothetical protein